MYLSCLTAQQIALQLVQQGVSNEPSSHASVQAVEHNGSKETSVGESTEVVTQGQVAAEKNDPATHEKIGETVPEADEMLTTLSSIRSPSAKVQTFDPKVSSQKPIYLVPRCIRMSIL